MQIKASKTHNKGDWSKSGLDLMRFTLALIVVLGHLTQPIFQQSWANLTTQAHVAVGGFFVLSGYTIRAITQRSKRFDVLTYSTDRASRLLSVSVLALILTIFTDTLSARLAPAFYAEHFGGSADMPVLRVLANLSLLSQVWGLDISPFSNSPFWSLSYEAGFYAIWAAYLYWIRERGSVLWLALVLLCLGPNIVFMLPFWLLGTMLFDISHWAPKYRNTLCLVILAGGLALLGAMALRHQGTFTILKSSVPAVQAGVDGLFAFLHINTSRIAVSVMAGAVITFLCLIPGLAIGDWLTRRRPFPAAASKVLATLGDLTFPLYLLHFPLMVLARAGNLYRPESNVDKMLLVLALLVIAHACTKLTDPFKLWMRRGMHHTFNLGRAFTAGRSRGL